MLAFAVALALVLAFAVALALVLPVVYWSVAPCKMLCLVGVVAVVVVGLCRIGQVLLALKEAVAQGL